MVASCPGGSIIIKLSPASDFCTPAVEEILTTLRRMRSVSRAVRSERVVTGNLFIEGATLGLTLRGMIGECVYCYRQPIYRRGDIGFNTEGYDR